MIYFANKGALDLEAVRVMGVSVKRGANAIGYFGTGLKYALAVLVRNSHAVTIWVNDVPHVVASRDAVIRGEPFKQLTLDGVDLPFTTDLGKNWEMWMAYRELHSNTLDEGGIITDDKDVVAAGEFDTVIAVSGVGVTKQYQERNTIFLESRPLCADARLEIHAGKSAVVYYRGVRAGRLLEPAMFTYNILTPCTLTEDRTFTSSWDVEWKLSTLIPAVASHDVAERLIADRKASFDSGLAFERCGAPSREFLTAAASHLSNARANRGAVELVDADIRERGEFKPASLSDSDVTKLVEALDIARRCGSTLTLDDVCVVESLGPAIEGIYHSAKDQVFIAASALNAGAEFAAAVIYEEYLHKAHKFADESRAFQTFLVHRVVAAVLGRPGAEPPDAAPPADDSDVPF